MPRANIFGDMITGGPAASEAALRQEGADAEDRTDLLQRIDVLETMIVQLRVDRAKLIKFRDAVWARAHAEATKEAGKIDHEK